MSARPGHPSPASGGATSASAYPAYVVDASVAIKLFVQEPLEQQSRALFNRLADPTPVVLHAPDLLFVECANILWKYARRYGYDPASAAAHLADLVALDLVSTPTRSLLHGAWELALQMGITACDGCYVALARETACPLITADERLLQRLDALQGVDVVWLGHYSL